MYGACKVHAAATAHVHNRACNDHNGMQSLDASILHLVNFVKVLKAGPMGLLLYRITNATIT